MAGGARGAGLSVAGQVAAMAIQFAGTIVLSRLLTPSDFGLIAMVAVFVAAGELIRDFGMPTAALQAKHLSDQQASNVFWTSSVLSLVVGAALALSAPLLAVLYGESRLLAVVPAMAAVLFINGLQAQYQVRLARAMRYGAIVANDVSARLAGLVAGVATALLGWQYWALVAQLAVVAAWTLVGAFLITRWRPTLPKRGSGSMHLFRSGGHLGTAQLLGFAADNADSLLIGMQFGPTALGFYNRAFQLFMAPVAAIFNPLVRVVIPTVNRAASEGGRPASILLRVQFSVCGAAIWVLTATAATAPWLVPLLLGEAWASMVPLLQILAIGGIFRSLSQPNYWAYLVQGDSKELLASNAITKPLQIVLLIMGAFISVEAVAWAYVVGRALTWPFNLLWMRRVSRDYSMPFFLNGLRLVFAAAGSFGTAVAVTSALGSDSLILNVLVGGVTATAAYLLLIAMVPGGISELRTAVRVARLALARGTGSSEET